MEQLQHSSVHCAVIIIIKKMNIRRNSILRIKKSADCD